MPNLTSKTAVISLEHASENGYQSINIDSMPSEQVQQVEADPISVLREQRAYSPNKDLLNACNALVQIANSINDDGKIKVSAKGVNSINRQLGCDMNLQRIRKIKTKHLPKKELIAQTLLKVAENIKLGKTYCDHISGVGEVERGLNFSFTSHTWCKSDFDRQRELTLKKGSVLSDYNELYWEGKYQDRSKYFYFPYQYRVKTKHEIAKEFEQAHEKALRADIRLNKAIRKAEKIEKNRVENASIIIANIENSVFDYLNKNHKKPLFLDTETTGLGRHNQVIELAIVDNDGFVVIDTLLYTDTLIEYDAKVIHCINESTIQNMPKFSEIQDCVLKLIANKDLWIFNKWFDIGVMENSACGDFSIDIKSTNCLMEFSAEKLGCNDRYISLANACYKCSVSSGTHRAKSDALASARLYNSLMNITPNQEF